MSMNKDSATLKRVVRDILAMASETERARAAAPRGTENDFQLIARRDYDRCLKLNFSRRELTKILGAFRTALPSLDHEQLKLMPLPSMANVASRLGLKFQANPFDGPGGAGLRGFYVATKALKQPLMCLNTAHHRTAINSTFWHEMGHHLMAPLLPHPEDSATLTFGRDFEGHLADPRELAADILVSLVCYSHSAAKQLFGPLLQKGSAGNIHAVVSSAKTYLEAAWGFNFDKRISAADNLHYLEGMIHFAKLRLALLAAYDV
jgi:hypothetical protein